MISTRAQDAMLSIAPGSFCGSGQTRDGGSRPVFLRCQENPAHARDSGSHGRQQALPGGLLWCPWFPIFRPPSCNTCWKNWIALRRILTLAATLEHSAFVTPEQKKLLEDFRSTHIDHGHLADAAAEAEPDPGRRQTLLQQIGRMTVAQRVQFAMKGSSEARRTLIRDSNKVVQRSVLQSPRLTDQEVEAFAAMANLTDEILRLIAGNRNFRKNYVVVRNLINNPKTPLDVTLHMLTGADGRRT